MKKKPGRKAIDGAKSKPTLVYMDNFSKNILRKFGGENLSLGIRLAARKINEETKK